ncbi:MAG: bifunctional phosphopantothenoylcysteine decarboxylase/phosphopantothenate--cysteine ligase CoaBC [Cyanobacteriota bacterium]
MTLLKGKNIVLGITGCIAAYKTAELIRLLVKSGANVEVIMTESATRFITPLTLSTLSQNKVYIDMFEEPENYSIDHISLADKADIIIVVPATANIIGKVANGIADDLLSSTIMAARSPVFIAPAMNTNMWNNSIVQENINKLRVKGYYFINPESGDLACGYKGDGRLRNINDIFAEVSDYFNIETPLKSKKILITIGPTREYIDPVRFITNKSSGKMGVAIAEEANRLGADVTVITSVPVSLEGIRIEMVETTSQMQEALKKHFCSADILIMAAAVADYTVKNYSDSKIKKSSSQSELTLNLAKTPDLLEQIAGIKTGNQIVIGFAAETNDLIANAKHKLESKKLDMIVANDVSRNDIGMNSDYNEVSFIYPDSKIEQLSKTTKQKVAVELMKRAIELVNKT